MRRKMRIREKILNTRRSFLRTLSGGLVAAPSLLKANPEKVLSPNTGRLTLKFDINIPQEKLEGIIWSLSDLADMQTSNHMAEYDDEDMEMTSLYREEARSVRTVLDVVRFITSLGQDHLIDYYDTIDYAEKFKVRHPENPGDLIPDYGNQETYFRKYLNEAYGINPVEFPLN